MINKILEKHYLLSFSWATIVLILSGLPGNDLPHFAIKGIDKFVHFSMYGTLAFFLMNSTWYLAGKMPLSNLKMLSVFVISASYGLIMEVLQQTIFIQRSFDLWDEVANTIGAIFGIIIYKLIR